MKVLMATALTLVALTTSSCGGGTNAIADLINNEPNVALVRDGSVQACPNATLGEMADAFFGNPSWSEFEADTGETVVELTGEMSMSGQPATALLQFTVDAANGSFDTEYLSIDGEGQSLLVTGVLLRKMCDAVA